MRGPRTRRKAALGFAVVVCLLSSVVLPLATAGSPAAGVTLTLGSDGSLTANLEAVVANGSALRYAMDGYFGPLVDSLPLNNSTKASILSTIALAENNPLTAGLFGDRTGQVNSVDVSRFQSLIVSEAKYVPVNTLTGVLNVSLDGTAAYGEHLSAVSFTGANGPDSSSAPVGVVATLSASLVWSGPGHSHTFELSWNLPSILGNLSLPTTSVNLSFTTPAALTITSVTGLNDTQVSNDVWGWGSASVSGQYEPLPGHDVVIQFGPSFPTGDVAIGVAVAAGVVLAVVALLLRRRHRKHPPAPTGPAGSSSGETGVGPSSGSG